MELGELINKITEKGHKSTQKYFRTIFIFRGPKHTIMTYKYNKQ